LLQTQLVNAMESVSSGGQVAVLLLDLDGLKWINDTYGHAIGDEVLAAVASRLGTVVRPSDTLARTGGDEFVIVCPGTSVAAATAIGERISAALAPPITLGPATINASASIGIAHHAGEPIDPSVLLARADHAMYDAKRGGRGRVRIAASTDAAAGDVAATALT
jgi:diguanylate cyclase (GGDEF)-like protein